MSSTTSAVGALVIAGLGTMTGYVAQSTGEPAFDVLQWGAMGLLAGFGYLHFKYVNGRSAAHSEATTRLATNQEQIAVTLATLAQIIQTLDGRHAATDAAIQNGFRQMERDHATLAGALGSSKPGGHK